MKHDQSFDRRQLVASMLFCWLMPSTRLYAATSTPMEVWTGPGCSCCHDWIAYLQANGFAVTTHDGGNMDARTRLGMPMQYGSCHTGEVGGYAIKVACPRQKSVACWKNDPTRSGSRCPPCHAAHPVWMAPHTAVLRTRTTFC